MNLWRSPQKFKSKNLHPQDSVGEPGKRDLSPIGQPIAAIRTKPPTQAEENRDFSQVDVGEDSKEKKNRVFWPNFCWLCHKKKGKNPFFSSIYVLIYRRLPSCLMGKIFLQKTCKFLWECLIIHLKQTRGRIDFNATGNPIHNRDNFFHKWN